MSTTSSDICAAAEQLEGFVGYHHKHKHFIVRFSEEAFGMDVTQDSITPTSEFVWSVGSGAQMSLSRERLQLLLDQNIDSRLNITEPLRVYMRRQDLPEIKVERWVKV
ncbi:DUF2025 family protein [Pseudomonas cichorii]|uniref:DUF2025 family protein n=1 Tax=Pseudomonas cichorii TaxID=36746 RepID=UPI001C8ABEFA|nr:DUF2025 family protein [Pseudomonas cichorii]MBX8494526.1 DUF2025 family protein [Pseudomonas cichorii]